MTSPIAVSEAVDNEAAASTRRALRSALARAAAGATSPGLTTRSRGRAVMAASLRMAPPWDGLRPTSSCGDRSRGGGEPVPTLPVVAEHVLAGAGRGEDDGPPLRRRPV